MRLQGPQRAGGQWRYCARKHHHPTSHAVARPPSTLSDVTTLGSPSVGTAAGDSPTSRVQGCRRRGAPWPRDPAQLAGVAPHAFVRDATRRRRATAGAVRSRVQPSKQKRRRSRMQPRELEVDDLRITRLSSPLFRMCWCPGAPHLHLRCPLPPVRRWFGLRRPVTIRSRMPGTILTWGYALLGFFLTMCGTGGMASGRSWVGRRDDRRSTSARRRLEARRGRSF